MKFYLAGPMSGIPQFNFPLFHSVAAKLRSSGYTVISPAELDSPEVQKAAMASTDGALKGTHNEIAGETWGDILAKDVKLVADKIDGIIFLPGWERSRGARLEGFVGLLIDKRPFEFHRWDADTETLSKMSKSSVMNAIYSAWQWGAAK